MNSPQQQILQLLLQLVVRETKCLLVLLDRCEHHCAVCTHWKRLTSQSAGIREWTIHDECLCHSEHIFAAGFVDAHFREATFNAMPSERTAANTTLRSTRIAMSASKKLVLTSVLAPATPTLVHCGGSSMPTASTARQALPMKYAAEPCLLRRGAVCRDVLAEVAAQLHRVASACSK